MPKTARKLPWFPFDAEAWLGDVELQSCSLAARGLWIQLLSLMHKSRRRGYLELNGQPMTLDQLARMAGCSSAEAAPLLQELFDAGVPSREPSGTIYSRRMVQDERERSQTRNRVEKHRARQKQGDTSPPARNGVRNATGNGDVTAQSKNSPPKPPAASPRDGSGVEQPPGGGGGERGRKRSPDPEPETPRSLTALERRLERDKRLAAKRGGTPTSNPKPGHGPGGDT